MPTNNERPFVPPTRKPVSEFPTPDPSVAFYTELVNRDDPAYIANSPVKRGALYSTMVGAKRDIIATYPNLFFLRERKFQLDDQKVLWDWATDEQAHDSYNAEVNYIANAVNYPAFTRTYTVRRELWEADPTVPIGSPLPGIIAVEITSPGQNHTKARGVIDGTSAEIEFAVSSNGGLINGIITNTGNEIIQDQTPITIIGDGQDSAAIARSQPVGCVLTSQKKEELPGDSPLSHELVRITRIYETLPGPWIYATRLDKDGAIVKSRTRRQVADFITDEDVILNGEWSQTSHKGSDNFVAEEVIETRPLPGNPIVTTKVDDDGMVVTITKILVDASTVVSGETLEAGIWTRTRKEELASTSFVKDTTATNKVCWQVSEARSIPGNPIPDTELDKDGVKIDIARTMKAATAISTTETLSGGIWVRTEADPITDLVSWEVVRARAVPGNVVPSANVDQDHETARIQTTIEDASAITSGAQESGGFIRTIEQREVTDLVSEKVVTDKKFLDAAFYSISIENLIPREFRAFIPTVIESHILAGTASLSTLALGEFEHSQRQITKLLYEDRITSLGPISLPIVHVNQELTELYGGGVLNVTLILDVTGAQTIDEGYLVTRSTLTVLGNGMDLKETAQLDGTEWPLLASVLWDENLRELYIRETQVKPYNTLPSPDPGGTFAWISETEEIDQWRVKLINISKPTPDYTDESSALISYAYKPYRFPGLLYYSGTGYYVRAADATLVQHKIKTWWEKTSTTPNPTIDEIILDDVVINNLTNTSLTYSGPVLHDDYSIGALFYPATTPSYTAYALGIPDGTFTLYNVATLFSPGSTGGYMVGDTIFINGSGHTMSVDVTFVYDVPGGASGLIGATTVTDTSGTYPPGSYGPFAATGGSGSGAFFNVFAFEKPNYTPGTAWIGTYRVIGASVTSEREKDVWKVQTESVVMR